MQSLSHCFIPFYFCIPFFHSHSTSHPVLVPFALQRQYIFIHDTLLEHLRAGNTEVSIQDLRKHYKQLQDQDPNLECSRMEKEYGVSGRGLQRTDNWEGGLVVVEYSERGLRYNSVINYLQTSSYVLKVQLIAEQ